jgi:hypothetical protein
MRLKTENPVAGDDRAPKRFRWAAETNSDHGQTPADRQARTARRRDFNAEARVQASIVEYVRAAAPETLVFHPANGGWRTPAEAARFRWLGVTAGVPDLVVIPPGGRAHFLEVKSERGSLRRPSARSWRSSRSWERWSRSFGRLMTFGALSANGRSRSARLAMAEREHLPDRRGAEVVTFEHAKRRWTATFARHNDGRVAEVFIDAERVDPIADLARESAILASLALQHGASLDELRHALAGRDVGPLAAALTAIECVP